MNEQFKTLDKHGGITIGQELTIVKSGKNVGRFIKMNERIRELAEQAGLKFDRYRMYVPSTLTVQETVNLQKFAELIVRECARLIRWEEYGMSKEQRIRLEIYQEIKQHFGVE